eukprot:m.292347 g.292347  ORF g.292347 m.292347 type:complete len:560 (-) comp15838_c2_seq1:28-1707(-)
MEQMESPYMELHGVGGGKDGSTSTDGAVGGVQRPRVDSDASDTSHTDSSLLQPSRSLVQAFVIDDTDADPFLEADELAYSDPSAGGVATSAGSSTSLPRKSSMCNIILLNAAWLGLAAVLVSWGVVMLPSQVRSTVGDDKAGLGLAAVVSVGSGVTLIASPLIGIFSDRCTSRFGRRRPFMLFGVVFVAVMQVLLGVSNPFKPPEKSDGCEASNITTITTQVPQEFTTHGHLGLLILFYSLATLGYQLIGVPYSGLLADLTPLQNRGVGSGIMGVTSVIGNLIGAAAGFLYASKLSIMSIYIIYSAFLAVSVGAVLVSQRETRHQRTEAEKKLKCKSVLVDYVRPLGHHDFRWVFLTRFLMQQGMATVMFFLQLYFHDMVPLPEGMRAEEAVSYALLPLLVSAALASVVSGHLSDRVGGKRKVFVISAALLMAVVTVVLVFVRNFTGCIIVAIVFGMGYGVFISVDFAMVLDVLPSDTDRAKDLGIWHQAMVLPQLIATPIGGLIRDEVSRVSCGTGSADSPNHCNESHCATAYIVLFSVTAAYFLLSALFVLKIRNVK